MASWLVHLTLDRVVCALIGQANFVLVLGKTLNSRSQCLYPPRCILQMGTGEYNAGGQSCDVLATHPGVEKVYCSHFNYAMYRNQDKLQPDGPLDLYADFTIT